MPKTKYGQKRTCRICSYQWIQRVNKPGKRCPNCNHLLEA